MSRQRRCGILCHPTSMPGPYGIGDLGAGTHRFLDFLAEAGQSVWQILPLGPTGYGDSPYQAFSAFAGNPLLISIASLIDEGLLERDELPADPGFSADAVRYGEVIAFANRALRLAHQRALTPGFEALQAELSGYRAAQAAWLEDYALFMALKLRYDWAVWTEWPEELALRRPEALEQARRESAHEIDFQCFAQYLFERQWRALRREVDHRGITIIGDVPLFVGHDSADVWAHRDLFQLDRHGRPTVVAGVPPDYFSPTGQLWGNPHYRWDVLRERGYGWWLARLQRVLSQVHLVRLDHFRGLSGYWEVPAGEETAINGRWVRGPGRDLMEAIKAAFGEPPLIAEDLGVITRDVVALREAYGLPGMRVLQFAFYSDASSTDLPHNYTPNTIVYTGTHDNDTTSGWWRTLEEPVRHRVRLYTGSNGEGMHWDLLRLALTSVADTAIYPLQDVLGLGSEARLNRPGQPYGNWTWRFRSEALTSHLAEALRELAALTGRRLAPEAEQPAGEPLEYEEP